MVSQYADANMVKTDFFEARSTALRQEHRTDRRFIRKPL